MDGAGNPELDRSVAVTVAELVPVFDIVFWGVMVLVNSMCVLKIDELADVPKLCSGEVTANGLSNLDEELEVGSELKIEDTRGVCVLTGTENTGVFELSKADMDVVTVAVKTFDTDIEVVKIALVLVLGATSA